MIIIITSISTECKYFYCNVFVNPSFKIHKLIILSVQTHRYRNTGTDTQTYTKGNDMHMRGCDNSRGYGDKHCCIHKGHSDTQTHSSGQHVKHQCTETPPVNSLAMT